MVHLRHSTNIGFIWAAAIFGDGFTGKKFTKTIMIEESDSKAL
jgi:hypothetical protein